MSPRQRHGKESLPPISPPPSLSLGDVLRTLRNAHGLTLRDVEDSTKISNAYLSQLETGKISRPDPNILFKLSQAYQASYQTLMERAGYITQVADPSSPSAARDSASPSSRKSRTLPGAALATIDDLTPEETHELMKYLAFIRSRRPKRKPPG
jgi:HTH-type transcriptional regulator, competence development regulator